MAPTLKVKPCEAFSKIYFKHNCCVNMSIQLRNLPAYFFLRIVWYPGPVYSSKMVHKGKCSIKSRLHIIRIFKSEQIFYCRPFSYYFLIIILQRSPKYFPLLPDFSNPLSLSFKDVRSTFICYRTSFRIIIFRRSLRYFYCLQSPYPNYPVIPQGPKHSSLLPGLTVILSLGLCASFVAGPSLVWSEVPVVLFGRPSSSVRGTKRAMDSGHTVQSEVLYMPLEKCQSVRSGA